MKILFLKDKRSPSGIEGAATYLLKLCKILNKIKIPYLVLYGGNKDIYFKQMIKNKINIRYFEFPKETPKNFLRLFKIMKIRKKLDNIIIKEKITIVNSHFPHLHFFLNQNLKIPLFSHWHGALPKNENKPINILDKENILNLKIRDILFKLYIKFIVFNYNLPHKIIAVSNASKNTLIKKYLAEKKKIVINRYGVEKYDTNKIKKIHKEFNLKNNTKIILSAGRITKDKGVEEFCEIAKKFSNKKVKFIFLGGYRDKVYYQTILKKYSNYVIFPGMRTDIERFYKSSYFFLFLSHRESAGQVLMEAMNFGLPLLGWNIIGVNEIIKNNYNGKLIKFRDKKKLEIEVRSLINDKKKYNFLSKNSYKSFKLYLIENSVDNLLKIFHEEKKN